MGEGSRSVVEIRALHSRLPLGTCWILKHGAWVCRWRLVEVLLRVGVETLLFILISCVQGWGRCAVASAHLLPFYCWTAFLVTVTSCVLNWLKMVALELVKLVSFGCGLTRGVKMNRMHWVECINAWMGGWSTIESIMALVLSIFLYMCSFHFVCLRLLFFFSFLPCNWTCAFLDMFWLDLELVWRSACFLFSLFCMITMTHLWFFLTFVSGFLGWRSMCRADNVLLLTELGRRNRMLTRRGSAFGDGWVILFLSHPCRIRMCGYGRCGTGSVLLVCAWSRVLTRDPIEIDIVPCSCPRSRVFILTISPTFCFLFLFVRLFIPWFSRVSLTRCDAMRGNGTDRLW